MNSATQGASQPLSVPARDGLRLHVRHFAATPERRRELPLLLLHGLASNGYCFCAPGASLAAHLAGLGYDCFVPDLRGVGQSERPDGGWSIDDYLEHDLPALIDAVLAHSGQRELGFIGHSLGGVLGLMYGIEHPRAPIARLVTVASTLDYASTPNMYHRLRKARPLLGGWLRSVPYRAIARANARVAGRGPLLPAERMNFFRANVDRAVSRDILAQGFEGIPVPLLDALNTTFEPGGFQRGGGRIRYLEQAERYVIPTLLIAGSRDPHCAVEAARKTAELLFQAACQVRGFGRAFGHAQDYGHFDLLAGTRAPAEVWPEVQLFLERGVQRPLESAPDVPDIDVA